MPCRRTVLYECSSTNWLYPLPLFYQSLSFILDFYYLYYTPECFECFNHAGMVTGWCMAAEWPYILFFALHFLLFVIGTGFVNCFWQTMQDFLIIFISLPPNFFLDFTLSLEAAGNYLLLSAHGQCDSVTYPSDYLMFTPERSMPLRCYPDFILQAQLIRFLPKNSP